MALAKTLTDVANLALLAIGEDVIQNIDSDGSNEVILRRAISEVTRQVQLMIHWPELLVVSAPSRTPDMFDDQRYKFNLSTQFLEVIKVYNSSDVEVEDWEIIGNKLITSEDAITLHYKKYSENVAEWSGRLIEVVYRKLALETAIKITTNPSLIGLLQQQYEIAKKEMTAKTQTRNRNYKKKREFFGYNQIRHNIFTGRNLGY